MMAALLLLVFAAVKIALLGWWRQKQPEAQQQACEVTRGCTLPSGVWVKFSDRIAAKEPFDIELRQVPAEVQEVHVSFSMKDMDMGFNRYRLKPEGNGVWAARTIRLPVCVSQRNDYLADINIGGQVVQTAFTAE